MDDPITAQHDDDSGKGLVQAALDEAALLPRPSDDVLPPPDSMTGYSIGGEMHRGAQGIVYVATHNATGRQVAVKVMRAGPFADDRDRARFEREVHILGQLHHPNIVTIHDSGVAGGHFYYVMDYIPGQSLDEWMAGPPRPVEETLRLFLKICDAVNAAHVRGVIHRDLKPGNIRITEDGEPHILDFGLAKLAGDGVQDDSGMSLTMTGQFLGSLPWASPEQLQGNAEIIDVRSDVYALGVIGYQMLTGEFPYAVVGRVPDVLQNIIKVDPARPSSIRRQINDEVETIILKCLEKDPQLRYQSTGELARDVGHYLAGRPIEAKRHSSWYVLRKHAGRHKGKIAAVLLPAVLLAAFAGVQHRQRVLQRAEQLVAEGRTLHQAGRWAEAGARYDEALQLRPNLYEALGYRAFLLKDEYYSKEYHFQDPGLLLESLRYCDRALQQRPQRHGLWNLRCVVLYSIGHLDEAEEACREALALDPEYFFAASNLAKVLALQHRFEEAVVVIQAVADAAAAGTNRDRYDDGVWRTLGTLQLYLGDPQAADSLETARKVHGRDTRNWLMTARLHLMLPEHIDAQQALDSAKHAHAFTTLIDPRFSRILAQALIANGLPEDALRHAQAAVAGGDLPAFGHAIRAAAYAQLGRSTAARNERDLAEQNWPEGFAEHEVLVTAEKGLLWFDTQSELEDLIGMADIRTED